MKYWYSAKGEEAYKAINLPYPKHPFDEAYSTFLRKTRNSKDNEFIINRMIRFQNAPEDDTNESKSRIYNI